MKVLYSIILLLLVASNNIFTYPAGCGSRGSQSAIGTHTANRTHHHKKNPPKKIEKIYSTIKRTGKAYVSRTWCNKNINQCKKYQKV